MLKYFSFYVFCLIVLAACNNATNNNTEQIKDSLVTLPFFNKQDWTPEWIGETDSAYKNIHAIPSFSFLDQNGKVVNENLVNGKIYVANFFFTKCRNICTKMTNNMHLLQ